MDKKYQVFISSTFVDLQDARQKVMDTILELHQIPAGMEMFPAADDDQWTHIKSEIDKSDYYVLILGHRYGSIASDGVSYTEKEYDYAREQNIPVLAFIMDRDAPVRASALNESAAAKKKLEKFILKAQSSKLCKVWSTPDDLATKVSTSLSYSFTTHPRLGWVRGDQAASPKIMDELVELNRENRELKANLESLKHLSEKNPDIQVKINNGEALELQYQQKVDYPKIDIPKKIDVDTIPEHLMKYIKAGGIEGYNDSVPEDFKKVKKYNQESEFYGRLESTGLELDISFLNIGKTKANNLFIEILFPVEVMIKEGAIEDFKKPSAPALHVNPLEKAESDYNAEKFGLGAVQRLASVYDKNWGLLNPGGGLSGSIGLAKRLTAPLNMNFYSSLKDHTITVYSKELLHTRGKTCEESYVLVPRKSGKFEIKVSVICEEYLSREEYIIPLIIREI